MKQLQLSNDDLRDLRNRLYFARGLEEKKSALQPYIDKYNKNLPKALNRMKINRFLNGGKLVTLSLQEQLLFYTDLALAMEVRNEQEFTYKLQEKSRDSGMPAEQFMLLLILIWKEYNKKGQGAAALKLVLQPKSMYAKEGTKLLRMYELNGHCPEGYEIEAYLEGGCVKCKKGKKLMQLYNNTKRIKKHSNGSEVEETNSVNNSKTRRKHYLDGNDWALRDITAKNDTTYQSNVNEVRYYDKDAKKHFDNLSKKSLLTKKHLLGGTLDFDKGVLNLTEFFKCGGKSKKVKKGEDGVNGVKVTRNTKNRITKTEATEKDLYTGKNAKTITYQGKRHTSQAYIPDVSRRDTMWVNPADNNVDPKYPAKNRRQFYQHQQIYNKK